MESEVDEETPGTKYTTRPLVLFPEAEGSVARVLRNTPCTQTNQIVGFEPVEKVPTRENEVRTGGKRGVHSHTRPGVMPDSAALSPSAKVQDKTEDGVGTMKATHFSSVYNMGPFQGERASMCSCAQCVCSIVIKGSRCSQLLLD